MASTDPFEPTAPDITLQLLAQQFGRDIYGKEVQNASTYSYTWMADQMGHVCLGILVNFFASWVVSWFAGPRTSDLLGFVLGAVGVSLWEWSAYSSAVKEATDRFPLDIKNLRNNAIIAAAYMVMGVAVGFGFHLGFHVSAWWGVGIFVAMVPVAVLAAPPWLRQKIIWQKAALPYLFRLADAKDTIDIDTARALQKLIDAGAAPTTQATPRQVVISGPIGSGRSALAAGIGTEFAFRKAAVRYLSLGALLEFAAATRTAPPPPEFGDEFGPPNIRYWGWPRAQVLVIDDVGPIIAAQNDDPGQFKSLLETKLAPIAAWLARCHTVWVIGDLAGTDDTSIDIDRFADIIRTFCNGRQDPLVIELVVAAAAARAGVDAVTKAAMAPAAPAETPPIKGVAKLRSS